MMINQVKITALFLLTIVLIGCDNAVVTPLEQIEQTVGMNETTLDLTGEIKTISTAAGSYQDVTAVGLAQMMTDQTFPLINVHIPYAGELDGTDAFVPFNEIGVNIAQLPQDFDAPIVLYCQSGGMSTAAAKELVALGYTNVFNLKGGMIGWQRAGFDLLKR